MMEYREVLEEKPPPMKDCSQGPSAASAGGAAERYDTQVEVLLNGTANAIRRQALPQLREVFAGRDQRKLRLLDIGCGTG